ncbi:hypothetical protein GCM10009836_16720 [Pseudonocardia ailaonensis]|uniref:SnoaL-like domain-containing protein n=1 Tax=Pseudonocardia ailaonensis TaxID=367279 RepID=A0ABN2MTS3_9PSEU
MTDPTTGATARWTSVAMNTPETAVEMAGRIRTSLQTGFEIYASVHKTLFAPVIQLAMAPFEQPAGDHLYAEMNHGEVGGNGNYGAFLRRTIPDIDIVGTATARDETTVVADHTITGTLPDGPLHLHSEATYTLEEGLVVRYLVRHDHAEWQRYLRATGNPYEGGGVAAAELDES